MQKTKKPVTPLTLSQIKPGQRIIQIDHPEYGVWVIAEHYHSTTWNVNRPSRGDGIATHEAELTKYWALAE